MVRNRIIPTLCTLMCAKSSNASNSLLETDSSQSCAQHKRCKCRLRHVSYYSEQLKVWFFWLLAYRAPRPDCPLHRPLPPCPELLSAPDLLHERLGVSKTFVWHAIDDSRRRVRLEVCDQRHCKQCRKCRVASNHVWCKDLHTQSAVLKNDFGLVLVSPGCVKKRCLSIASCYAPSMHLPSSSVNSSLDRMRHACSKHNPSSGAKDRRPSRNRVRHLAPFR